MTPLKIHESIEKENDPILESEVRAIQTLKTRKSPVYDTLPAELLKSGGDSIIRIFTVICNKIWKMGSWPSEWTS